MSDFRIRDMDDFPEFVTVIVVGVVLCAVAAALFVWVP